MKKITFRILIVSISLLTFSCSKKEKIEPVTSANRDGNAASIIAPNRIIGSVVPMGSLRVNDMWNVKPFYDFITGIQSGDVQYRVVIGGMVQMNKGISVHTYLYVSSDANYVEFYSQTAGRSIKLPISSPGKYAYSMYYDPYSKAWVKSSDQVLFAPNRECASDTQKPVANNKVCNNYGYLVACSTLNSYRRTYPSPLGNYIASMMNTFQITDNCDGDLTIRQIPDPSTMISSPKSLSVSFEITDNNNNTLTVSLPVKLHKL